MSKLVKNLITNELKQRWEGVGEAMLVDISQLEANANVALRKQLREQDVHLLVVKNSLARRASEGTALAPAFEGLSGTTAVVWGASDVVSLAKVVTKLHEDDALEHFTTKGGVMDGAKITPEEIKEVSKWPTRDELIATVAGQAIGIGSEFAGQLIGPAQELASQIEELIKRKEEAGETAE